MRCLRNVQFLTHPVFKRAANLPTNYFGVVDYRVKAYWASDKLDLEQYDKAKLFLARAYGAKVLIFALHSRRVLLRGARCRNDVITSYRKHMLP